MTNNIKIHFKQPEYIVDEANGVVICKLKFNTTAPIMVRWGIISPIHEDPTLTEQVVKTVVFAKNGDKFDVNVGKKVALAKAENLAYSYVNNWVKSANKELINACAAIREFSNKTNKVREHNVEYIKKF